MGHGASVDIASYGFHKKSIKDVVALMMPVFYTEEIVSDNDVMVASASWDLVLDDQAPTYIALKANGSTIPSSIMLFYDTFYKRLFDIHPVCNTLVLVYFDY